MLGKKLINAGPVGSSGPTPSNYFNTVLYTGNGGTQRIGGYINRGAVFNGSSSYITIPINKLTNTFSFSTWLYLDDLSTSYRWVFGNWNSTTQDLYVMIRDTGKIEVNPDGNNGTVEFGSSGAFSTNTWHHLAVSMDAGTYTVYLDGSSLGSGSTTNTTFDNGNNYQIGKAPNSSINEWSGKIDQFRLFDKAISSSEVTTLYGETFASTTKSTTDIFSDNSGVALYQFEGNANDTGGASGKFGSGAIFTGSSASTGSRISLSNNVYGSSTTVFSASLWVKCTNTAGEIPIIGNGSTVGGTTGYVVYINSGSLTLSFANGSSYDFFYGQSINDNNWHHIVITYNNGAYVLYLDNSVELNGTSSIFLNNATPTYDTFLGNRWARTQDTSNAVLNGVIDDLRIYSDILTSTEVGYIYNNTTASIPTNNLEAYYKFDGDARDEQQLYDGTASNVTYAYDGTATNVTYQEATNFSPDLVWIKSRSNAASNFLFDTIRGTSNWLASDLNLGQNVASGVTSFDSNGFTLGSNGAMNGSSTTYAAWCFNAGTDAAASNTDGSITSTVKANPDAGFSIVKYTGNGTNGATVGHGLDDPPELIITKGLSTAYNWNVVTSLFQDGYLELNTTSAFNSNSARYITAGNTTNSLTNYVQFNQNNIEHIAYCFHSVDGIQKVGSYTGNGSANGTIVETGFEPAFVLIKRTDGANSWAIHDNKRATSNPRNKELFANLSDSEGTFTALDFLSNGFQLKTSNTLYNGSSNNYIYLAIAADPDTTTPTVENSFDVVTWTGNGGTQTINTDFKPDLVWLKSRNNASWSHFLQDSVRGAENFLISNLTNAEATTLPHIVDSFDTNGFTVLGNGNSNNNNDTYVAWCWKAGDHDDNLPQINTEGTIDSVVSVNDAAGFSIVSFTGPATNVTATVGHGLSAAPELVITKILNSSVNWYTSIGGITGNDNDYLSLNTTDAVNNNPSFVFGPHSSTTFTTSQAFSGNNPSIAYCFHSVDGYQKIGSYTSNASVKITTGFEPRWIMIKYTGAASDWWIMDTARYDGSTGTHGGKLVKPFLEANTSDAEASPTSGSVEFVSDGFYPTNFFNSNGVIYLAIA